MKKYTTIIRGSIMQDLSFRASTMVRFIGNLIYLVIVYFLWKAIFDSSPTDVVNGMTFYDTLVYLVLASALTNVMNVFVVWEVGSDYQTGDISLYLAKPIEYQIYLFCQRIGRCVMNFVISFLPTFVIVYFLTKGTIVLGMNLLFFLLSVMLGTTISFCIDFLVGTICYYTQSIWGVNIMKDVVVALLSGATIPLAFFPQALRQVVNVLPFQAIYHMPLNILTNKSLGIGNYLESLGIQALWLVVMFGISKLFWKVSIKKLTVNGG